VLASISVMFVLLAYGYVLYNCAQVVVGDYDELRIPQEAHRIQRAASEKLDQVD